MNRIKKYLIKLLEKESPSISKNILHSAGYNTNRIDDKSSYNVLKGIIQSKDFPDLPFLMVNNEPVPNEQQSTSVLPIPIHTNELNTKDSTLVNSNLKVDSNLNVDNNVNNNKRLRSPSNVSAWSRAQPNTPRNSINDEMNMENLTSCNNYQLETSPAVDLKEQFKVMCILGKGGCGQVYYALDTVANKHVIIKSNNNKFGFCQNMSSPIDNEIAILNKLRENDERCHHTFVPCLVDFFTDVDKQTYLITEAFIDEKTNLPAKDLKYVLKHNGESTFPLRDRLNVYLLILKTVEYLTEIGIKHKDLKPENILVNSNYDKIQIIDFGVACYEGDTWCFRGFTAKYQPAGYQQPKHTTYNQIGDLYSLIVIFGDLLYAKKYDITLLEIEHISLLQFAERLTRTRPDLTSLLMFYKLLLSNCDGSQFCNNKITIPQLITIFQKVCNSFA